MNRIIGNRSIPILGQQKMPDKVTITITADMRTGQCMVDPSILLPAVTIGDMLSRAVTGIFQMIGQQESLLIRPDAAGPMGENDGEKDHDQNRGSNPGTGGNGGADPDAAGN